MYSSVCVAAQECIHSYPLDAAGVCVTKALALILAPALELVHMIRAVNFDSKSKKTVKIVRRTPPPRWHVITKQARVGEWRIARPASR